MIKVNYLTRARPISFLFPGRLFANRPLNLVRTKGRQQKLTVHRRFIVMFVLNGSNTFSVMENGQSGREIVHRGLVWVRRRARPSETLSRVHCFCLPRWPAFGVHFQKLQGPIGTFCERKLGFRQNSRTGFSNEVRSLCRIGP